MNNYKIIDEKYINEVGSNAIVYEHIKTKAQVLCLINDDENKAFGIGFRTVPEDSTGVAHIVEHCTLSGSRKYRTREPFMDLIQSSMQTFLNAMTYPDKTLYPISSRNKKDFYNLMDVYLDAVFYPRMYEKKEIFMQEGWHYELENLESDLLLNGVVYNEMKGVYSDPQNIVSDVITFNLHKDSSYGVDSGGNPKNIPDLTYENFLAFHKKYYHPSNSYIYLYGDLNMEEALKYIDENYLRDFEYEDIDSKIILNEAFKEQKTVYDTYSASNDEMGKNKDYLAYSWCIGNSKNKKDLFLRDFLSELLIDAEAAPIKKALLKAGLGEDIYAETSSSETLDLSIIVKNTSKDRLEEFKNIVENTLKDLIKNGINRDLLEATLNKFEFAFREGGGTQRSIIYYIRALNSWLYDESPFNGLTFNDVIDELKENINSDFFEKYIEEKLLNNPYSLISIVTPELDKNLKEEKELKEKLENIKNNMSKEELENIMKEHKELIDFQMTEDSKEDKATIPSLELSDISKNITHIPREEIEEEPYKVLINEQFTNNLSYVTLAFDANHFSEKEIFNLSLLTDLYGKVNTKNYSYEDLNNEIYKTMGGFVVNNLTYSDSKDYKKFYPYVNVTMKMLDDKIKDSLILMDEILNHSDFSDKNRIKEILLSEKSQMESAILQNGHGIVSEIVKSYYSAQGDYNGKTSGLPIYFYIADLLEDFDNKWEDFKNSLEDISKKIFVQNRLILNYTGDKKTYTANKENFKNLVKTFNSNNFEEIPYTFVENNKNEAYKTSANVQYVSKGYNLNALGEEYNGALAVLGNILSISYLHYNIRAKGGAYGAGIRFSRTGDILTYSYRDPHLANTVKVYDEIPEFVENLDISESELKDFIIGSMNSFDPLLSPVLKGEVNLSRYISNITEESIEKIKKEAIDTSLEKLKSYSSILKNAMDKNYICAIGGEEKIKKDASLFKEVINLKR
ncbi:insulinase family protein [Peptoniphilus stercorisuis]|uniref:Zn-dependent M16 (Insulinase) family peptidase n=1 Tax=Peptoniphilus stercorisuis TaxID=1436965 RepID=A0ABS4KEE8_9FIRM|nr:insulinase family protein [Peptoniphilus stercorisuis]MBP2026120.1 Zn-dependent M16 (insulinase) family peptidase [Peptoniphilus stercorisuis]